MQKESAITAYPTLLTVTSQDRFAHSHFYHSFRCTDGPRLQRLQSDRVGDITLLLKQLSHLLRKEKRLCTQM
jgi:hypothetical protein